MGVVLPHGGLVAFPVLMPALQWASAKMGLGESIANMDCAFAAKGNRLGYFRKRSVVLPLMLIDDARNQRWYLALDGVRPPGFPQYYLTEKTANALLEGDTHGDGTIEIEGVRYRLHAAFLESVHVALLMRAKW